MAGWENDIKEDKCCGGLPVHGSVKCMGIWSILQTFLVLSEGMALVADDKFIGFYLIFFNLMYILNSVAYYRWFKDDCFETRQRVAKTYLYILIQTYILYIGLFIIVWHIPASALPDKYEDNFGGKYEFPPE